MNSPFDQQPPDAPVVNLMQQQSEDFSPAPDFSNDSVVPGVASSGGKKKLFILLAVVLVLVLGGLGFALMSSDSSSSDVGAAPAPALVPMAAPADVPPAAPPVMAESPALAPALPAGPGAVHPCEQKMIDYALQNGADAKAYVEQNQAYLEQCKQAMAAGAQ